MNTRAITPDPRATPVHSGVGAFARNERSAGGRAGHARRETDGTMSEEGKLLARRDDLEVTTACRPES